jgi:hypothetical protein
MSNTPDRLNYEIRDGQGNIIAATTDFSVAEAIYNLGIIPKSARIYECGFPVTHRAWFPCDFSSYYANDPKPYVTIEGTVYKQARTELETVDIEGGVLWQEN